MVDHTACLPGLSPVESKLLDVRFDGGLIRFPAERFDHSWPKSA